MATKITPTANKSTVREYKGAVPAHKPASEKIPIYNAPTAELEQGAKAAPHGSAAPVRQDANNASNMLKGVQQTAYPTVEIDAVRLPAETSGKTGLRFAEMPEYEPRQLYDYEKDLAEDREFPERKKIKAAPRAKLFSPVFTKKSAKKRAVKSDAPYIEPREQYEDYKNYGETKKVLKRLESMKLSALVSFVCLAALALFAVYLVLSTYSPFLSNFAIPDISPKLGSEPAQTYAVISLLGLVAAVLICNRYVLDGLRRFVRLKSSADSLVSVAALFALGFNIYAAAAPSVLALDGVHLYNPVIVAAFAFNALGRLLRIKRTLENFNLLSTMKDKTSMEVVRDLDLRDELNRVMGDPLGSSAVPVKSGFCKRFLELSLEGDDKGNAEKIISPIAFLAAVAVSVGAFILWRNGGAALGQGIVQALSVFMAILCVCAPFTSLLCTNLPLGFAAKKLVKMGAIVSGNEAVNEFSQVNSIVVNASSLFPKGSISLKGIKTFDGGKIDECIIDATSVMNAMNGTLKDTFLGIIQNRTDILSDVDSITYEEGMGVSAWVKNKRVLIGNRELMRNHNNIIMPAADFEEKYKTDGREVVYLASSSVLMAMYIIKYMGEIHIGALLKKLLASGISVIVRTSDPNISAKKIGEIFEIPQDDMAGIHIIPERSGGAFERVTRPRPRIDAKLVYSEKLTACLNAVISAVRIWTTSSVLTGAQTILLTAGYAIITFCAFFSRLDMVTPLTVMLYNLAWAFSAWLISLLREIQ
ncbi:MAG: hypothetical protein LBC56_02525 [Oscillospiraceae bacterium]|jgi:cation transport ATPase|nr:hypothetical protein [Oscillospiraceae bacterium]